MAKRRKKNTRAATAWFCVALLLLTVATGLLATLSTRGELPRWALPEWAPPKSGASSSSCADSSPADDSAAVEPTEPPAELRAVRLTPGVDFPLGAGADETKTRIDAAISQAIELTMNALVIDTNAGGQVAYPSSLLPCVAPAAEFDPIAYAIEQGKALGLYTCLVYYATGCTLNGAPVSSGILDAGVIDAVTSDVSNFAESYRPDAVLLDGYYNVVREDSYAEYLREGGGVGYERYMTGLSSTLVTLARGALRDRMPAVRVGLLTEPVWANLDDEERGSDTGATFAALTDGSADLLAMMEDGLADFVAVKAFGSTENAREPYKTVVGWWSAACSARSTPLYVMHASSKAITDEAGWGEYDQLSRQVIEARELAGFSGSIFDSLSRMVENPKEFATKLIGYYNGSVKPEHIMTDLELTQPAKTTFTSFEKTVVFAGNTDPNTDATINGVPIKVDENGYFALEMELTEGKNTFQIVHKGRTASYQITRVIEVVREVTPQSGTSIEADGGTKLTISAVAYREAKVYAVINGKTVSLKIPEDEGDGDHDLRGTAYARFTGVYTVPDATTSVQNLGPITVWGEWGEIKKSKQGAVIKVNARALPSDGTPIVVTAAWAETFPSSTLSQYSHPNYLPLPKGALDYAIGNEIKYTFVNDRNVLTTYKFYKLQSGLRVFSDDISAVSVNSAPVNNVITGCTVASDDRYTKVILATRQQVSYVAKYSESSDRLTVQFNYTNSLPESMTLNKNPLFSAVTFSGDTMTLKFREKGVFLGYDAYFDDSGNLVMRFNNPPQVSGNDLSGVRIAIDPGHGGNDSGALGYLGAYPERVVNWSISSKLASVLKSRGAEVIMWDTRYNNYSLPQRVQMAVDAEPHLLLSVHSNSAGSNRAATGSEAYYFTPWSYALSQYAAGNLAGALGTENRGGKFGYYYLTRNTQFSSALVETGFMTNQNEYSKLVDDSYQNRMATGLANAITQYFQLMGKNAGLTGTQSSGSAVTDSGQGTGSAAARPPQTDVTLELSESALELAVDDEVTLEAWVGGLDNAEIVWSAEGNREVAELIEEGDTMTLVALMPGTMVITAQIKGQSACVASCKLTVTA